MTWQDEAACLDGDLNLFFPDEEEMTVEAFRETVLAAKAICTSCPKTRECADYAVRNGIMHGIFGGMLPEERVRWSKRQRVPQENMELFA